MIVSGQGQATFIVNNGIGIGCTNTYMSAWITCRYVSNTVKKAVHTKLASFMSTHA